VKNLLLMDAMLTILFLSDTYEGRVHDKRMADANSYRLPPGSHLLQDLGFLAFALENCTTLTPFRKPRGKQLTAEQTAFNQQLAHRRVRIEHVNASVKRCRIVKDACRLRLIGARDAVMEICCALHNFRLLFYPWLPIT
jgi:DDE superfamily endonuclease